MKAAWAGCVLDKESWVSAGSADSFFSTILLPGALLAAGDVGLHGVTDFALQKSFEGLLEDHLEERPEAPADAATLLPALKPGVTWFRRREAPSRAASSIGAAGSTAVGGPAGSIAAGGPAGSTAAGGSVGSTVAPAGAHAAAARASGRLHAGCCRSAVQLAVAGVASPGAPAALFVRKTLADLRVGQATGEGAEPLNLQPEGEHEQAAREQDIKSLLRMYKVATPQNPAAEYEALEHALSQMAAFGTEYAVIYSGTFLIALRLVVDARGAATARALVAHQRSKTTPPWRLLGDVLRAAARAPPCAAPLPVVHRARLCVDERKMNAGGDAGCQTSTGAQCKGAHRAFASSPKTRWTRLR